MVERAFGSLRSKIDERLEDEPERPVRQTGDDIFESDPKGLLGSLLKIKEKAAVDGVGRYATIRIHQGHCQAAQGGAELKVSLACNRSRAMARRPTSGGWGARSWTRRWMGEGVISFQCAINTPRFMTSKSKMHAQIHSSPRQSFTPPNVVTILVLPG